MKLNHTRSNLITGTRIKETRRKNAIKRIEHLLRSNSYHSVHFLFMQYFNCHVKNLDHRPQLLELSDKFFASINQMADS